METIRQRCLKKYGYIPSDNEILKSYWSGELILNDKEEDELLEHFNL
jgi:hypothetical protein